MFPFHRSGELSFQLSNDLENTSNSNSNSNSGNVYYNPSSSRVEQDGSAPSTTHLHRQQANSARRGRPRRLAPSTIEVNNNEDQGQISGNDVAQRRVMHREIERQRRQEMASLYSCLRNLLPMDYIRGKRSMCDHITEAAKYIKDLESNIKEFREKRDMLKASPSSSGDVGCSSSATSSWRSDCNVSIHTSSGVIEIEISTGVGEEDVFPLSRVLKLLIQEGLNVVDCVASKINQRLIHLIHCEVTDEISIDSSQLQQKLLSEIAFSDD